MLKLLPYHLYENDREYIDHYEPYSDEIITSDQGYVDVAKQIESMMIAGQLLQESRPNTRNLIFEYDDDQSAYSDYDYPSAVDRRGSDIVDLTREADDLNQRISQAKAEQAKADQAKADQVKADQAKGDVNSNE